MSEFEPGSTPEQEGGEKEPTPTDLAEACREVLTEVDCQELEALPLDEGVGYAFTLLLENGIDDPDAFLREKGIIE